jgi:hypothetical protein
VERDHTIFFVAHPWRAIADMIYLRNKGWGSIEDLCEDLRIEQEELAATDTSVLKELAENYPDNRTRMALTRFVGDLI